LQQRNGFVHGAMLLAGAAVVTKLLGSIYTIVLQNVIGDHGMGLFQMAYPIYATLLAVATAGFPVAVSKLVSERLALGDQGAVRQVLRVTTVLLSVAGVVTFSLLFFGADIWARIAGDIHASWAIRAIAPALLIVPVMSALRGYFQGFQWMEPTATSQVVEQFVRVATILGLAIWITSAGYGKHLAAAGAAFGAVTGAFAGMVLLLYYWIFKHPESELLPAVRAISSRALSRQLIYYAFPISLGALVVPLMNNIDVITVVNLLKHSGEGQSLATTEFGLLSGRAFKLMMLPTTLASGIGIAVMPAVSEAFTLGFRRLMSERIDTAIRLTMMLALPAAMGLALLAKPIDVALFKDTAGYETIQMMSIATVFASVQTTVAAILQGAGWVYLPVLNLVIASVVKLSTNLIWVPAYGIRGAAAATVIAYALAMVLNFLAMFRHLEQPMRWGRWLGKPLVATFIMSAGVYAMHIQWLRWGGWHATRPETAVASAVMIGIGMIVYGISLLATGGMNEKECRSIPRIGPSLATFFLKIGLLRT
jgi:PST family polysaccharide transporter